MSVARRKRFTTKPPAPVRPAVAAQPVALTAEIRQLIEAARQRVAQAVNAGLTVLYWQIGSRIRQGILKKKRAEYGEEILPTLSAKLVPEFGRGYSARNLARMAANRVEYIEERPATIQHWRSTWTEWLVVLMCFQFLGRGLSNRFHQERDARVDGRHQGGRH